METITYEGIEITKSKEVTMDEVNAYIKFLHEKHPKRTFKSITMKVDPIDSDMIDLNFVMEPIKFERIRRITGYLVGTMDKWNDGKAAEEHDRVKHSTDDSGLEQL